MSETRVGEAWGEQYSAGMSSKEAQAFKRGWDAAINMLADHFDTPRIVWSGHSGVTVFDSVEHADAGVPRAKDLTVWMREQLSDSGVVSSKTESVVDDREAVVGELTPRQAFVLIAGWQAEQSRVRHEAEPWPSQAERDVKVRDERIEAAVERGIPRGQVERFVYSGPMAIDKDDKYYA